MKIDFDVVFIGAVLIWVFLIIFFKFKFKKSYTYLFLFTIFYIYICKVLDYTHFPIIVDEQIREIMGGQNVWKEANLIPFNLKYFSIKTSILNILLTIPFGFGLPFIAKINFKRIILIGIFLGIFLETLQLIVALLVGFTFRYVDINDVIFNFSGVLLGYGIFKVFKIVYKFLIQKLDIKLNPFLQYIYEQNEINTKR